MSTGSPQSRLIVALDQPEPDAAWRFVERLGDAVSFYKIGWVSLLHGGVELVRRVRGANKDVFLDLKFFDVPETMHKAVRFVAELGVRFATIHGNRENVVAALKGRGERPLELLAVTMLTSMSEADVRQLYGLPEGITLEDHVVRVAGTLVSQGCDGVVASPNEIARIREAVPATAPIVTPGVRLEGESVHDHKRPGTPYQSILAGADYIVVGRAIYEADDPREQVERYVGEIARGLADRPPV